MLTPTAIQMLAYLTITVAVGVVIGYSVFTHVKCKPKGFVPDPKSTSGIVGTVDGELAVDLLAAVKAAMCNHPTGPKCLEVYRRVLSMEIRRCEAMRIVKVNESEAIAWIKEVNK